MYPIARVLAHRGSDLAWLLEHQLAGLAAALKRVTTERPEDPAAADCQALVETIERMIGPNRSPPLATADVGSGSDEESALSVAQPIRDRSAERTGGGARVSVTDTLGSLRDVLDADPQLRAMLLPAGRWRPGSAAEWAALHLAGLALDPAAARAWGEQLAKLGGHPPADRPEPTTAGPEPLLLVPKLPGKERMDGVRCTPNDPPDPRIIDVAKGWTGEDWEGDCLHRLVPYVSVWLTLSGKAPYLVHCLEAVNRHGLVPLEGDQRERYEQALVMRLHELAASADRPLADRVAAWVRIDEAVNALFFQPIEDTNSRWANWKWGTRSIVLEWAKKQREQGQRLHLRTLPAEYAQTQRENLTRRASDIPQPGAPLGRVVATLRLWYQVEGKVELGRALYGNG